MPGKNACVRRRLTPLAISAALLSACANTGFERAGAPGLCPIPRDYSAAEQEMAADEIEALPEGAVIVDMLIDYWSLREQIIAAEVGS